MTEVTMLLTERKTAKLLGVSKMCLAIWRSRGTGPDYYRLSDGQIGYSPEKLKEFAATVRRDHKGKIFNRSRSKMKKLAELPDWLSEPFPRWAEIYNYVRDGGTYLDGAIHFGFTNRQRVEQLVRMLEEKMRQGPESITERTRAGYRKHYGDPK